MVFTSGGSRSFRLAVNFVEAWILDEAGGVATTV